MNEVVSQYEGDTFALDAIFGLEVSKDMTEVDVEKLEAKGRQKFLCAFQNY